MHTRYNLHVKNISLYEIHYKDCAGTENSRRKVEIYEREYSRSR